LISQGKINAALGRIKSLSIIRHEAKRAAGTTFPPLLSRAVRLGVPPVGIYSDIQSKIDDGRSETFPTIYSNKPNKLHSSQWS
jgi:hypothetical protein